MAKGLYKFYWDCGRSGKLESIFVADAKEIENVFGREVYFGEVLGKHSEIYGTLEAGDFTLLTEDKSFIELFEKHIGTVGYNPFDYIEEDEEEDEE